MANISRRDISGIVTAGLWITFSEFFRNEILFKSYWIDHYNNLGLTFETLPLNGIIWTVWSLVFAVVIWLLLQKYSAVQTFAIAWLAGFVLMWLTTFNLQVLPLGLLVWAVPLSILEVVLAELIIGRIAINQKKQSV